MKVLLFTHKNDIDGMGSAVLAKLAFDDVEYVLCETFNLNLEISKFLEDGRIYSFDKIFVTDLWPKDYIFEKITNDDKLKDKFFIFDHHSSSLDNPFSKESFSTVKISNHKGLCCGTSLFYDYLLECGFFFLILPSVERFVELTRLHDTWEWKNIYNDEEARELSILFDCVEPSKYIELMVEKLDKNFNFSFNQIERNLINNRLIDINKKNIEYSNNIKYKEILGLKAGIIEIEYSFRNEIAEYLRENHFDMDFVMFVVKERGTASYRSIKDGVNVKEVAVYFGGQGHVPAATSPLDNPKMQELLKDLN